MYAGSERVDIWLGVRLLLRPVRRGVRVAVAAWAWFVAAVPAISSAVRFRTVVGDGRCRLRIRIDGKCMAGSFEKSDFL